MVRFSLASLVLATLCVSISSAAHAKTCIRDLAGQIVCGELVETRDEPDQAGGSNEKSQHESMFPFERLPPARSNPSCVMRPRLKRRARM